MVLYCAYAGLHHLIEICTKLFFDPLTMVLFENLLCLD